MIKLEYQNIKNIFAKGYVPNLSEEVFVNKKVKNTVPWSYVICYFLILTEKKLLEYFTKRNYKKKNQNKFRVEKVIKRKGNKLYVK